MQYSTINLLTALSVLPLSLAQYGYGDSSSTSSAASAASTAKAVDGVHVVKVGQSGLTFSPNNLTVPVGDTVEFHFWPKAHSVAQSSFAEPCAPLNQTAGFFSGPIAVASGMSDQVFSIKIENESPIWYYCATGNHCQSGMAGVINPPANGQRTIAQYIAAAANADENVTPASVQGGTIGAAATAPPTSTGSPSSTATPGAGVEARGAISWGLLVGGALGGLLI